MTNGAPRFDPSQPFTTEGSTITTTDQPTDKPRFDPTQSFTQTTPATSNTWWGRNVAPAASYIGNEIERSIGDNWLAFNLARAGAPELGIMPPDPSTVPQTFEQWKSLAPPEQAPPEGPAGNIAGAIAAPAREYLGSFGPLNLLMPPGAVALGAELGEGMKQMGAGPIPQAVANALGSGGYGLVKTGMEKAAQSIPAIADRLIKSSGRIDPANFKPAIKEAQDAFENIIQQTMRTGKQAVDNDTFQYITNLLGNPDANVSPAQNFINAAKTDLGKLRELFPDSADQLAAYHVQKSAEDESFWKSLSKEDKANLVEDSGDRNAMDAHFKEPGVVSKFIHGAATGGAAAATTYGAGKFLESALGIPSEWVDPVLEYAKPYIALASAAAFGKPAAKTMQKVLGGGAARVPGYAGSGFMQQFWQTPEGQNQLNQMQQSMVPRVEPHITATRPAGVEP